MKKQFVVTITALIVLIVFAIFIFKNNSPKEMPMSASVDHYQHLIDVAGKNSDLNNLLTEAAKTKWTEVTLRPKLPEGLKIQDEKGMPTQEWQDWSEKNSKTLSLKNLNEVLAAVAQTPEGTINLADPNDTPQSYDRSFISVEFAGGKITKVEPRSL